MGPASYSLVRKKKDPHVTPMHLYIFEFFMTREHDC